MLSRNYFSVTYPGVETKYTNFFVAFHEYLKVKCPVIDIRNATRNGLVRPESVNIHFLQERFLHLPFKNTLGDGSNLKNLSIDITNTTELRGSIYSDRFENHKEAIDDPNCIFLTIEAGERLHIPNKAILVNDILMRDCSVRTLAILHKVELGATSGPHGPQGIDGPIKPENAVGKGTGEVVQHFYTIGSVKPKEVYDAVMKRMDEVLDEIVEIFSSEYFEYHLRENNMSTEVKGLYYHWLNLIADFDENLFIEHNTSMQYYSDKYVKIKMIALDGFKEAAEMARKEVFKLKFKIEK